MPKDKPLELVRIPLSQIKPDPKNAKDHDVGLIIESFRRFGYVSPMVLNSDDFLLAGHGRRKALLTMQGDSESPPKNIEVKGDEWIVPVGVGPDFDQREGTAYRLVDNRSTEVGGYDEPQLLENLMELSKNGGLEATGYDTEDVDRLFQLLNPNLEEIAVSDEAEKLQHKWKTKSGQLWEIGRHRLICGDATNASDVERLLDGAVPNIMVTDPPYGVEYDPDWRARAVKEGWLKYSDGTPGYAPSRVGAITHDDTADWSNAYSLFPGNIIYAWSPGTRGIETGIALVKANFVIRAQIIWAKSNFPLGRGHYTFRHEPCWYAVRKSKGASWIGERNADTLWKINLDENVAGGHSTQKPLECMARPIRNHSGDVYDPFLGSGTTMVAAEQLNRTAYCMEIEPKYVAVILERMSTMGLEPELISGA